MSNSDGGSWDSWRRAHRVDFYLKKTLTIQVEQPHKVSQTRHKNFNSTCRTSQHSESDQAQKL
jgi:hypothetical protein